MKIITPQQIEDIKNYLNTRQTIQARRIIDNLETSNEEDILKDLKELLKSHKGRSTIINKEIEDIINKYGNN